LAFRQRRRLIATGSRRETSWLDIEPALFTVSGGGSALLTHTMTAAELARRPFTIIRTHVLIHVQSDQLAASENFLGAWGGCIVSSQARAIGITALPTPITDMASDLFFIHSVIAGRFAFQTGVGFDDNAGNIVRLDSKAMRKINDDQEVVFTLEGDALGGGLNAMIAGRLLIKEH